ncbi:MAG: LytTR family DNA-binding domain-containing protein [Reyranella sp.]|nr:LytTR family DNA-binding domain-containing protein [Reyranella sp.]
MRESPYLRSFPYQAPWVIGLAVVMAVTGPFGTYAYMDLGVRLVYFGAIAVASWLQVIVLAAWFGGIEPINRWPVAVRMALVGVLAAVPGTLEIIAVHSWLVRPIPWSIAPSLFPQNAFLTAAISVVVGLFVEQRLHAAADAERARVAALPQPATPRADAPGADAPAAAPPDFFRRVPPALGRDLLALEMEDHYLRIHTALGSDLILLRLRDALGELGPSRGRQVHRSWWVAEGAVASAERDPRRPILVLRNGLRVPVSKSFRDQVKEAGWLDG